MEELVKRAKVGDNQAFTELIMNIQMDLYKIAKAKIKDDDDINEAIQETIIKAYSSIKKLKDEKYFKTWIIRILINECNNIYKKKKVNKIEEYNENVIKEADSDMINTKINNLDFFILIDKLNEDEKIVVVLFYLEEYSTKQLDMKIDNTNKTEFTAQERVLDDNNKIIMNNVGNTKFATYITIQKITENMTYKEFEDLNPWKYNSFIITDENGEEISFTIRSGDWAGKYLYVKNDNGELKLIDNENRKDIKDNDEIYYVENFILLIGEQENLNKINIVPIETTMFYDRNNEEAEEYKKVKWYPLVEGENKYSATSSLGGTLEIENIKIDENYITFYYNKKGLIGNDSLIILRKNNGQMNYIYPTEIEEKGINSTENKAIFSRSLDGVAGLNTISLQDLDKNLENIEFALLYGSRSKIIAEEFIIQIPEQDNQTAKIDNIEIVDIDSVE